MGRSFYDYDNATILKLDDHVLLLDQTDNIVLMIGKTLS